MRRQRVLDPDDSRAPRRRKAHGLTPAEHNALVLAQGGRCAICGRVAPLQVDHDHRHCSGTQGCRLCIRGLLCNRCNSGLGRIGDRNIPALLRYLSR